MATSNGITLEERVRCRHHMDYLNVASAATFVFGTPAAVETQFLIEPAMDKVLVEAVPLFRQILATLDALEAQMVEDHETLVASRVGQTELRGDEQQQLDARYRRWQGKLSNLLGAPSNPFDKNGGGGINARVMHG